MSRMNWFPGASFVNLGAPFPLQPQSAATPRHGFTESGSERMVRDWILLAAAITGASTALVLQDETGIWYRDSSGLTPEQLMVLEPALTQGFTLESNVCLLQGHGFQVIEALPLVNVYHRVIGTLCVLSPVPLVLSASHHEGLSLVVGHLQQILTTEQQKLETRGTPRAPSATSFVPGLVHELRNFVFGISANLDVFKARFAGQEEISKYGTTIRKSLDRLNTFIEELREYGDPKSFKWAERQLEPLLREALEHLKSLVAGNHVDFQLHVEGPLPPLNVDEQSLRAAFIHLLNLVLQQEEAGGCVMLHLATRLQGERVLICGHLDGSGLKVKDVDLARLFEPFYFRASGLGRLALPLARRVFESHGGNLTAGPGPEGGMRISFTLPAVLTYPLRSAGQA